MFVNSTNDRNRVGNLWSFKPSFRGKRKCDQWSSSTVRRDDRPQESENDSEDDCRDGLWKMYVYIYCSSRGMWSHSRSPPSCARLRTNIYSKYVHIYSVHTHNTLLKHNFATLVVVHCQQQQRRNNTDAVEFHSDSDNAICYYYVTTFLRGEPAVVCELPAGVRESWNTISVPRRTTLVS